MTTLNLTLNLTFFHSNKDSKKELTFNSTISMFQFQTKKHWALKTKIESNIKCPPFNSTFIHSIKDSWIHLNNSFEHCNISTCSFSKCFSIPYICFKYINIWLDPESSLPSILTYLSLCLTSILLCWHLLLLCKYFCSSCYINTYTSTSLPSKIVLYNK